MDLHVATERVASLKDALLRYLVIVAGIVTALALGQWTEGRHNARQGQQALAAITGELRRNEALLESSLAVQDRQLASLAAAEAVLGKAGFAAPGLPARARQLLQGDQLQVVGNTQLVALQRSAWDAAIANQSLQHVPADRLVTLARAYAAMQEVSLVLRQLALGDAYLANLWTLDAYSRGEAADAMRFARALREHHGSQQAIRNGYAALLGIVREAAQGPGAAASSASAASGGG